jgi:hypothetical protein
MQPGVHVLLSTPIHPHAGAEMMIKLGWDKNKLSSSEWMVVEACERAGVLDKGHLVAVDNFYASPKLFAEMVKRDTDMVCSLCPADTHTTPLVHVSPPTSTTLSTHFLIHYAGWYNQSEPAGLAQRPDCPAAKERPATR